MRDCYLGLKTMKGHNKVLYLEPGWNANLDGATLDGATWTVLPWTVLPTYMMR